MSSGMTPDCFAVTPLRIDLPAPAYNWASQTSFDQAMCDFTGQGTQTFDHKGQPRDSDND